MADKTSRESQTLAVARSVALVAGTGPVAVSLLPLEQRAEAQQQFTRVEAGQTVQLSTIVDGQSVTG